MRTSPLHSGMLCTPRYPCLEMPTHSFCSSHENALHRQPILGNVTDKGSGCELRFSAAFVLGYALHRFPQPGSEYGRDIKTDSSLGDTGSLQESAWAPALPDSFFQPSFNCMTVCHASIQCSLFLSSCEVRLVQQPDGPPSLTWLPLYFLSFRFFS